MWQKYIKKVADLQVWQSLTSFYMNHNSITDNGLINLFKTPCAPWFSNCSSKQLQGVVIAKTPMKLDNPSKHGDAFLSLSRSFNEHWVETAAGHDPMGSDEVCAGGSLLTGLPYSLYRHHHKKKTVTWTQWTTHISDVGLYCLSCPLQQSLRQVIGLLVQILCGKRLISFLNDNVWYAAECCAPHQGVRIWKVSFSLLALKWTADIFQKVLPWVLN